MNKIKGYSRFAAIIAVLVTALTLAPVAVAAVSATDVQKAYLAYFGRPADPAGLAYWKTQDATTMKAGFSKSLEYATLYTGMTSTQMVAQVYTNLLGRTAEAAGLTYWSGEMTAGRQTVSTLVDAMQTNALGADITTINNRVTYATAFTAALDTPAEIAGYSGTTAANAARAAVATVVDTDASLIAAQTALNTSVATVTAADEGIVFVSLRDGMNGIWGMNTDGTNPRRLSSVAKNYFGDNYPSSSPDGSKIVFTREGTGIVVLDNTGEKIVRNFSYGNDPRYTTWSYNGKIYFTGWNATHQHSFVYSVNADGTGEAQASPAYISTYDPNDFHPSISPDGLSLLFSTNRTGSGGTITKMTISSGSTTYLTYAVGGLGVSVITPAESPTWSPDGSKIAFAAYPGYPDFTLKEQIYVMSADGSAKVKLTSETGANCRFPSWSPDGTKIVFQKDYPSFSNTTEIWIMNADGSGGKALTDRNVTNYDAQPSFIKKPR